MKCEDIVKLSRENLEYMREIRRHLHKNPGVDFDNNETIQYIHQKLSEMQIEAEFVGKCGLSAIIGEGEKCFLLRADTDGLATAEETNLEYASRNGRMHSCGHDIHTAQLLGAVKILKTQCEKIGGCVKLMFQSAEEILCGAVDMIENGILENPTPNGALMIHVMTATELKTGTVIVATPGESAPCADFFEITVSGKGCHGSSPALGKDPIYTACTIVTSLSEITSRELSFSQRAILTFGSVTAGNSANVIPEFATLRGTMRCFTNELREYIKRRIVEISEGVAKTFGTSVKVTFTSGCPSLVNDKNLCNIALESIGRVLGKKYVINSAELNTKSTKTSGSEDFSYISQQVPSVMLALASGNVKDGYTYPLHHPKVTFDEEAMINGCASLVSVCLGFFGNLSQ
ncbi:MAG: amidohydrolase [Clostridia bacterium]|nr:amidohydrolase [Clostridia bacterium]